MLLSVEATVQLAESPRVCAFRLLVSSQFCAGLGIAPPQLLDTEHFTSHDMQGLEVGAFTYILLPLGTKAALPNLWVYAILYYILIF